MIEYTRKNQVKRLNREWVEYLPYEGIWRKRPCVLVYGTEYDVLRHVIIVDDAQVACAVRSRLAPDNRRLTGNRVGPDLQSYPMHVKRDAVAIGAHNVVRMVNLGSMTSVHDTINLRRAVRIVRKSVRNRCGSSTI